jgi:hypothetical protein
VGSADSDAAGSLPSSPASRSFTEPGTDLLGWHCKHTILRSALLVQTLYIVLWMHTHADILTLATVLVLHGYAVFVVCQRPSLCILFSTCYICGVPVALCLPEHSKVSVWV